MKKLFLLSAILVASTQIFNSCSSRDEDPTPQKQDFTNADFIKSTIQGEWKGIYSSNNGNQWQTLEGPYNVGYKTTYKFSGNNFTYRPFVKDEFAKEYNGTYTILPVNGNANAVLMLKFAPGGVYGDTVLTLLSFEDNVITFVMPASGYPNGIQYYKFKKQ